jgi:hypothetical protein
MGSLVLLGPAAALSTHGVRGRRRKKFRRGHSRRGLGRNYFSRSYGINISRRMRTVYARLTKRSTGASSTRSTFYIGNPNGMQHQNCDRCHNDRMSRWEFGKDVTLLLDKALKVGIKANSFAVVALWATAARIQVTTTPHSGVPKFCAIFRSQCVAGWRLFAAE